jgi:hypothetical protein
MTNTESIEIMETTTRSSIRVKEERERMGSMPALRSFLALRSLGEGGRVKEDLLNRNLLTFFSPLSHGIVGTVP